MTAFPHWSWEQIRLEVEERQQTPSRIHQGSSCLCGPAAFLFAIARDEPVRYGQLIEDLFHRGYAELGDLVIEPSFACRHAKPLSHLSACDWIGLASLRDSENRWLRYDSPQREFPGITLPAELARWFRLAGYRQVREAARIYFNASLDNLHLADAWKREDHHVCLLIDSYLVKADPPQLRPRWRQIFTCASHWVTLMTPLEWFDHEVRFQVYHWGNAEHPVPLHGRVPIDVLLQNYYGFVTAQRRKGT